MSAHQPTVHSKNNYLNVNNVKRSRVTLPVDDDANTAGVVTASDHADVAGLEADEIHNLVGGNVDPDGVVDLDQRVREADGPAVVGVQNGDVLWADADLGDAAQLVFGLLGGDAMHAEPALHVVNQTEVLVGLTQLNDVHESGGESAVGPHFAVDLDQTLLHNGLHFVLVQGVFQAVSQEKSDGHRLPHGVWAGRWPDGENTSQLVQHP